MTIRSAGNGDGHAGSRFDVVGFGAMNMDQLVLVSSLPRGSAEVAPLRVLYSPGGSAANTVYALGKLGLRTGFVGAVGSDQNGRELCRSLREAHVNIDGVAVKKGATTGLAVALSSLDGVRLLMPDPGANGCLEPDDLAPALDLMGRARVLHLSSFVDRDQMALQEWALEELQARGTLPTVSIAPGDLYARRLTELQPILRRSHFVILNRHELFCLTGTADPAAGSEILHGYGVRYVAVTLGRGAPRGELPRGKAGAPGRVARPGPAARARPGWITAALCRRGSAPLWIAAPSEPGGDEPAETVGAGDAFAAGLLFAYTRGYPLETWGYVGQAMAVRAIRQAGARPGLPALGELEDLYHELYGCLLPTPAPASSDGRRGQAEAQEEPARELAPKY